MQPCSLHAAGLTGTRLYDGEGRLDSITWEQSRTTVSQLVYTYNSAGTARARPGRTARRGAMCITAAARSPAEQRLRR
ncbi:MAG: hypothetical protein ACOYMN_21845, partial [Roseimicrobium sp.]